MTSQGYRGYRSEEGEHWSALFFGRYQSRVVHESGLNPIGIAKDVHHFRLDCDWNNTSDPAVTLEGLDP